MPLYTKFADRRMICVVHGKSHYYEKAPSTVLGALISPSQEAFTMFLYRNGYQKCVWMHNESVMSYEQSVTSNGDTSTSCPAYINTTRSGDLRTRNGWWSTEYMLKCNEMYTAV